MSKAFTRESDDAPEEKLLPRLPPLLPAGAKNYLTSAGAQKLQSELNQLQAERPNLTSLSSDDARVQLLSVDKRIQQLHQFLEAPVIVTPPAPPWDHVRFGCTVAVRDQRGEVSSYRIVGIGETDIDRNWVSWLSPIAKALLNARLNQRVRLRLPAGEEELEVIAIAYE